MAHAQTDPGIKWSATDGLRIGDLAPLVQLPEAGKFFDSRELMGQQSLFLIVDGPTPLLKAEKLTQAVQQAVERKIALALLAPNPRIGVDYAWPAPFSTLRAPDGSLRGLPAPSFLAIDRAGWLREIESLPPSETDPDNVRLRFLLASTTDPTPILEVGKPAPDFSFRDANGLWRRVSALRGRRNLLLTFFPKCFTGRCRTHLTSLRDQYPGFLASETEIWAVSTDAAEGEDGQIAFSQELNLPFPMLPDRGRNVSILYRAANSIYEMAGRHSILIDKNGIVRWIDLQVNASTHGEDVLAKINELGLVK